MIKMISFPLLLAMPGISSAADVMFYWEHGMEIPGTTFELEVNGQAVTSIEGLQYRASVPGQAGDPMIARVRAVAPEGFDCTGSQSPCPKSEWTSLDTIIPQIPADQGDIMISADKRN